MSKYYYKKYEVGQVYADRYTTFSYKGTSTSSYLSYNKLYTLGTTYALSALTTDVVESILKSNVSADSAAGLYCSSGLTEITDTSYTAAQYEGLIALIDTQVYAAQPGIETACLTIPRYSRTIAQLKSASSKLVYNVGYLQSLRGNGAGTYIGEVIAEDGTYPDEGKGDDGYWYVKDRLAVEFKARVDGAWVATEPYVRVDGVWVKADVHPRVDGAWVG